MYVETVDVNSGRESRLGDGSYPCPGRIMWLQNSSGIILSSADGSSLNSQLWQVSYPDGEARRITNDLNLYTDVGITADGSAIVAVQTAILANLWVASATDITVNSGAKQITSGWARGWLSGCFLDPDGRILYAYFDRGESKVATISPTAASPRIFHSRSFYSAPSACGDGQAIVFGGLIPGKEGSIWRSNSDGGNLHQLAHSASAFYPACPPNAKAVLYTDFIKGEPHLWQVAIDGDQPIQLSTSR